MKASERLRLEASLGNNVYQPWPMVALREAADLLDECERALSQLLMLSDGVPLTGIQASQYQTNARATLANLRAAQEKADE